MDGIFTFIGGAMVDFLDAYVMKTSASLSLYVGGFMLSAVTLYYLFVGFAVTRGEVHEPIKTIVWQSFKMVMILFVATGTGVYQNEVIGTVHTVSSGLMETITTSAGGNCGITTAGSKAVLSALDCNVKIAGNVIQGIDNYKNQLVASFGGGLTGAVIAFPLTTELALYKILISISMAIMFVAAAVVFLANTVTLYLVLTVGPIFIGALAFNPTKRFFEGWLNKIVYCLALQMFIIIFMTLTFSITESYLDHAFHAINVDSVSTYLMQASALDFKFIVLCILFLFFAYMFTKLDNIANSLVGGGDSANGLGMAMAINHFMNRFSKNNQGGNQKTDGGKIDNASPTGGGKQGASVAHRIAKRFRNR